MYKVQMLHKNQVFKEFSYNKERPAVAKYDLLEKEKPSRKGYTLKLIQTT